MATLGNRSGSLQDGAIVPSDLLSSQKGTPLLVHPVLPPNIGSPSDAATLGERGSAFPATHVLPLKSVFCFCFCIYPAKKEGGGGGGYKVVTQIYFPLVWPKSQITLAGTVRSAPPPVWAWLKYITHSKFIIHSKSLPLFMAVECDIRCKKTL